MRLKLWKDVCNASIKCNCDYIEKARKQRNYGKEVWVFILAHKERKILSSSALVLSGHSSFLRFSWKN